MTYMGHFGFNIFNIITSSCMPRKINVVMVFFVFIFLFFISFPFNSMYIIDVHKILFVSSCICVKCVIHVLMFYLPGTLNLGLRITKFDKSNFAGKYKMYSQSRGFDLTKFHSNSRRFHFFSPNCNFILRSDFYIY